MKIFNYLLVGVLITLGIAACETPANRKKDVAEKSTPNVNDSMVRDVKYRKNIDHLTEQELAAYEHAVKMMKQKSQENVYDRTGFLWQAWVHDCTSISVTDDRQLSIFDINELHRCSFQVSDPSHREHPGMCEHAKDTFYSGIVLNFTITKSHCRLQIRKESMVQVPAT